MFYVINFVKVNFSNLIFFSFDKNKKTSKPAFLDFCRYFMPGLILALAACGGGGDGAMPDASSPAGNPLPPEAVVADLDIDQFIDNPEYQGQVGLAVTKAANAYARGLTGDGVRLGFTDTGLDETHPEFEASRIYMNNREQLGGSPATMEQLDHGTTVVSVAAGARGSGNGMHGVAYDAEIGMYTLRLTDENLIISDSIFNSGLTQLHEQDTDIFNHSWGLSVQFDPSAAGTQRTLLLSEYGTSISTIANNPGLHVWSAGNEGGDQLSLSAALPLFFDELEGRVLVVAAVDSEGRIGADSNRCGLARAFCLAAPGGYNDDAVYVRGARAGGGYQSVTGTSFAAPHVAAALALMKELFGAQMTDTELAQRLLQTADSTGIYADQDVYGQGLLDIEAATNPVGPTHVLAGDKKIRVDRSGFDFSHVDEALLEKLKQQKIVVHDSLGGPFIVPLSVFSKSSNHAAAQKSSTFFPAEQSPPSREMNFIKTQAKVSAWSHADPGSLAGLVMTPDQGARPTIMRNPYFGLVQNAMVTRISNGKIHLTGVLSRPDGTEMDQQAGVMAHYTRLTGTSRLSVQAGLMLEDHAWLGNRGKGLFSTRGRGQNLFVGIGSGTTLANGWTSAIGMYAGLSSHRAAQTGQLVELEDLKSFAFEYTLSRPVAGGMVYTQVGQPLRIEKGALRMHLPVSRLPGGGQVFENVRVELAPDGRLLDWRFGYVGRNAGLSRFGIEVQLSDDILRPGTAVSQLRMAGSWRMQF